MLDPTLLLKSEECSDHNDSVVVIKRAQPIQTNGRIGIYEISCTEAANEGSTFNAENYY